MATILLRDLRHTYMASPQSDADWALKKFTLELADGGAYALLGPSGCGKTTLLNLISGLLTPTEGRILFDGRDVTSASPEERNIAQVFQFPVIYDTMTVYDNLAFPLRNRRVSQREVDDRVRDVATMLELDSMLKHRAAGLTADGKQKISLGRGLVRSDVNVIMFDEPLTVIDPHLKWVLRSKLKELHHRINRTMIYVTHDQTEALTLSDLVVVMHQARVAQVGTPRVLYEAPASLFVADFLGDSNLLAAKVMRADGDEIVVEIGSGETIRATRGTRATPEGSRVVVLIRPEDMSVATTPERGDGHDALTGHVKDISYHGDTFKLDVAVGEEVLKVKVAREHGAGMERGRQVFLRWKSAAARVLPAAELPNDAPDGDGR